MVETLTFSNSTVEIQPRRGYLYVVETGSLTDDPDIDEYCRHLDKALRTSKQQHILIDARQTEGDPSFTQREGMWTWLAERNDRLRKIAFVMLSELGMAQVNMRAVAEGLRVRAFADVGRAQRFLIRSMSSQRTPAVQIETPPKSGEN